MIEAQQIRIMLVDDHAVVRSGIRRLLEQTDGLVVVAEAESGESAYQQFTECLPDVTVMDLTMPGMGGLESIRRIIARHPTAKLLVLSMHEIAAFASQALKAGAKGYLSKSSLAQELVNAIETIVKGHTYIGPDMAKKIASQSLQDDGGPMQQLSAREFEIFRLLAEGQDIDGIAQALKISSKTVANYQTVIKQKLNISTPVELVRIAIRSGLIDS